MGDGRAKSGEVRSPAVRCLDNYAAIRDGAARGDPRCESRMALLYALGGVAAGLFGAFGSLSALALGVESTAWLCAAAAVAALPVFAAGAWISQMVDASGCWSAEEVQKEGIKQEGKYFFSAVITSFAFSLLSLLSGVSHWIVLIAVAASAPGALGAFAMIIRPDLVGLAAYRTNPRWFERRREAEEEI